MAIEDALYTRLQAVSAVTNLVSTRVYPAKTENQNPTSPYVTYEVLRTERKSAMSADTGDVRSELRLHVWAQDTSSAAGFDTCKSVALQIRGALQRYRGTVASTTVQDMFIVDEFTVDEPEPGWSHRIIEFEGIWKE
jgi:hypothetical protein